jgi:hypothetical protein
MADIHRVAWAVTDPPQGSKLKARWLRVGVFFLNKDGSETLLLDALPVSGKLVLQTPKVGEDEKEAAEGVKEAASFSSKHCLLRLPLWCFNRSWCAAV